MATFSKDLVLEGTLLGRSCVSGFSVSVIRNTTKHNDPFVNRNTAKIGTSSEINVA